MRVYFGEDRRRLSRRWGSYFRVRDFIDCVDKRTIMFYALSKCVKLGRRRYHDEIYLVLLFDRKFISEFEAGVAKELGQKMLIDLIEGNMRVSDELRVHREGLINHRGIQIRSVYHHVYADELVGKEIAKRRMASLEHTLEPSNTQPSKGSRL